MGGGWGGGGGGGGGLLINLVHSANVHTAEVIHYHFVLKGRQVGHIDSV